MHLALFLVTRILVLARLKPPRIRRSVPGPSRPITRSAVAKVSEPVVVRADIGTRIKDMSFTAGLVTDGKQVRMRAGLQGHRDNHHWRLGVERSGSQKPAVVWDAAVQSEAEFDVEFHGSPAGGRRRF